jgi:ABC-type uncharacterized transport system permease subunit
MSLVVALIIAGIVLFYWRAALAIVAVAVFALVLLGVFALLHAGALGSDAPPIQSLSSVQSAPIPGSDGPG